MTALVVDSSIAVKWTIPEQDSGDALQLRRFRLIAPDLLMAECANVLWKKVMRGEIALEEALGATQLLRLAAIELVSGDMLMERTAEIAVTLRHPAYDCMYLALAVREDCRMVTADERLVRRVDASDQFRGRVIPLRQAVQDLLR